MHLYLFVLYSTVESRQESIGWRERGEGGGRQRSSRQDLNSGHREHSYALTTRLSVPACFITLTQNELLKLLHMLILSKEDTVCLYSDVE